MLAAALQTPELALDKQESELLAKAVADVAAHYNTVVDPKVIAWGNLAMTVGMVYGPRVIVLARKEKKRNTKKDDAATVVPFNLNN